MNVADRFHLQIGPVRGAAIHAGRHELTPVAFRVAAQWRTPGDVAAGGYAYCYPLAIEIKDGPSTTWRLIPDITRLATLGLALLTFTVTSRARARRGEMS
ncbi:MAG: hypothetical protein ACYC4L_08055 [Chloroflexota bacterium]